ncbi:MAG: hypothetical protein JWO13_3350 [Acidobacteriales bacterium]|nr:hypothetical protein [Terriglobales bacterium]
MKATKLHLTLAILICAISQSAMAFDVKGSFTRTLTVSGTPDIEITTGSGDIRIHSGNTTSVVVSARISANDTWFGGGLSAEEKVKKIEANPPITQSGSFIRIGRIDDRDLRNNVSISYDVTVPNTSRVRTETGSGDQNVQDVQGPLKASSGSGTISASKIGSEVRVSTGSGDINLDDVKGSVYASAGSGTIKAGGIAGSFYADTGSGDVTLSQTAPGHVSAKTGSGHVVLKNVKGGVEARTGSGGVEAQGEAKSDWDIHTGSGDVILRLPSQAAFNVDARSSSGNVTVNHPLTIQGTMKKNRVQGKVGAGGPALNVETGSGEIRIE